jgi:hypothetical protein
VLYVVIPVPDDGDREGGEPHLARARDPWAGRPPGCPADRRVGKRLHLYFGLLPPRRLSLGVPLLGGPPMSFSFSRPTSTRMAPGEPRRPRWLTPIHPPGPDLGFTPRAPSHGRQRGSTSSAFAPAAAAPLMCRPGDESESAIAGFRPVAQPRGTCVRSLRRGTCPWKAQNGVSGHLCRRMCRAAPSACLSQRGVPVAGAAERLQIGQVMDTAHVVSAPHQRVDVVDLDGQDGALGHVVERPDLQRAWPRTPAGADLGQDRPASPAAAPTRITVTA